VGHSAGSAAEPAAIGTDTREAATEPTNAKVASVPGSLVVFLLDPASLDVVPAAEIRTVDQVFADYAEAEVPDRWLLADHSPTEGSDWRLVRPQESAAALPDGLPALFADEEDGPAL
jgi:hypothetical protein